MPEILLYSLALSFFLHTEHLRLTCWQRRTDTLIYQHIVQCEQLDELAELWRGRLERFEVILETTTESDT